MTSTIEPRDLSFAVDQGAGGMWNPRLPELSHTLNAFQLALPFLEPYFIAAVREAAARATSPTLTSDAAAFCDQEANHARQHVRYSRLLRERYPRLSEFERPIRESLAASRREHPLEWRLAYTAGYEAITAQMSRWMFRSADEWFRGADPHFAALMVWHGVEEIEHRNVAFDALLATTRSYPLRVRGLFAAVRKTLADMIPAVTYMLEVDGYAHRLDSRARRAKIRLTLAGEILPLVVRYLAPGYHPSRDPEPRGFSEWLSVYRSGEPPLTWVPAPRG